MRVTINTEEFQFVAGFFKREPRWKVTCKIEFSPEELAIIRQRNFGDLQIYTQDTGIGEPTDIKLAAVIKHGIWNVFNTPLAAKQFENELTSELLPSLKTYLTASADVETGTKVLEF